MTAAVRREEGWIAGPSGLALGVTWYRPNRPAGPAVLLVRAFGHDDDAAAHGVHHVARALAGAGHPVVTMSLLDSSPIRMLCSLPSSWDIRSKRDRLIPNSVRSRRRASLLINL